MSTHLIKHIYKRSNILSAKDFINWALENEIEFVDTTNNDVFTIIDKHGNCSDGGIVGQAEFFKIIGKNIYYGHDAKNVNIADTLKLL